MTLWPDTIVLGGASIALADVVADVTIHTGRTDVADDPTPSTCQITLWHVTHVFTKAFRVGGPLVVTAKDGAGASKPRFTGRITDAALLVDTLTVIAAARLSTLGAYTIGTVAWPIESWSARVSRCFTEAGLAGMLELQPDPRFDPQLAARDPVTAGPTKLSDYLAFLAPMVGAAIVDRPDGKILVQAIGARELAGAGELDPALVEYAPQWEQVLPQANVVTVRYTGDQSEQVTARDDASIGVYGERPSTTDTSFVTAADATTRATTRLARGSFPHWAIPEAPVLAGLELTVGEPLVVPMLPDASPYPLWEPIVEGWEDRISGPDWTMRVALSDPLASGLTLPWNAVPADYLWNTINPATPWADALTLGDLTPTGTRELADAG